MWHGGSVLVVIIAVVVGGVASCGGGWLSFVGWVDMGLSSG